MEDQKLVTQFNMHLRNLIDLFLDIYSDDKDVHQIHIELNACMDNLPYKIIDTIGPYVALIAKKVVEKDRNFFVTDDFKISDDPDVAKFTLMFKRYWGSFTEKLQDVVFARIHNMLSIQLKYAKLI